MTSSNLKIDRHLLEASASAQIVFDRDIRILEVNARHCAMTGRRREDVIDRYTFDVFPSNPDASATNAEAQLRHSIDRVFQTGKPDELPVLEHDVTDASNAFQQRFWNVTHTPIFADPDAQTHVAAVLQTSSDVTEVELEKRKMSARIRTARGHTGVAEFSYDPTHHALEHSGGLAQLFGLPEAAGSGDATSVTERIEPDDLPSIDTMLQQMLAGPDGTMGHFDYRVTGDDGETRWINSTGEIVRDPVTQTRHVVGVVSDVTRYKKTEEDLRKALEMRDLLIAEVNHRVKNSLQLVNSILAVEARKLTSPDAKAALASATDRVGAIATIHASLYEDGDVRSARIDKYLHALGADLQRSADSDTRKISVNVDADAVRLPTDSAISLALAVNELASNAFKHAFSKRTSGTVTVSLKQQNDGFLVLEVSDDGTGVTSADLSPHTTSSGLGTRLIDGAIAQLGGTIEQTSSKNGWKTRIRFGG